MKISISEIKTQIDHCQSAESELLKYREQLKQLRAVLSEAEREAGLANSAAKFEKIVDGLEVQRREISDIEYRAGLHEKNLARIQSALWQQGSAIVAAAKTHFEELVKAVVAELHGRIAPFLAAKQVRSAIPVTLVRPLNHPRKLATAIEGHVPQLRTDCAEACRLILLKYEALIASGVAIKAELKIA